MAEALLTVNRAAFAISYQSSKVTTDMRDLLCAAFVKKIGDNQYLKDTPEVREALESMKVGIIA